MRTSNTTVAVPVAAFVVRRSDRAKAIVLIRKLAEMTIAQGACANEQKIARSKARSLIRRFDLVPEDVLSAPVEY